jgi:hypothetical protein
MHLVTTRLATPTLAIGSSALFDNTTGTANVAVGSGALTNNSTGIGNTALGYNAGSSLSTGNYNIDIGFNVTGVRNEANTIRIGDVQTTLSSPASAGQPLHQV